MSELLPCPFCGKADLDQWPCEWLDSSGANVIRCAWCHGAAPAKAWNRRAEAAQLRAEKEAAERDAARWNAWCERHPLTTFRALTGEGIEGKPYQPDKINAAMDEVIASGGYSLGPDLFAAAIAAMHQEQTP